MLILLSNHFYKKYYLFSLSIDLHVLERTV